MKANTLCSWELFAGFTLTHLSWWEHERILHKTFRRQREAGKRGKKGWSEGRTDGCVNEEGRGSSATEAAEEVFLSPAWRDRVVTLIKKWEGRLVRLTADSF